MKVYFIKRVSMSDFKTQEVKDGGHGSPVYGRSVVIAFILVIAGKLPFLLIVLYLTSIFRKLIRNVDVPVITSNAARSSTLRLINDPTNRSAACLQADA